MGPDYIAGSGNRGAPDDRESLPEQGSQEHEASNTLPMTPDVGDRGMSPTQPGIRARLRQVPLRFVSALLLVVVVCGGFSASIARLNALYLDARTAEHAAQTHVAAIQAILAGGDYTSRPTLLALLSQLTALDQDVSRIQSDIPFPSIVARAPQASGPVHLLRMADDLARAGESGVDAALIILPSLTDLASISGASAAAPAAQAPPALTTNNITQARHDVDQAAALLQQALAERKLVSTADLKQVGLASVAPMLAKLDAADRQLPTYLGYAHTMLDALPALLGVTSPVNYLLFEMDSDELRPTGGFLGNYAVLTFSDGRLTSGIHLHDIYGLDCPVGRGACPLKSHPAQFDWFTTDGGRFALRDSNLDPDYPASARLAEQLFTAEGGPPVQGVISITPAFFEQLLTLTGPIHVGGFNVTVTAQNLRDLIHYFHIQSGLGNTAGVSGSSLQTSNRKAFDAAFGDAFLPVLTQLSPAQRSGVEHLLAQAISAGDVQVYFNNQETEALLSTLGFDGSVRSPKGDSLMVVDTNVGANYANADVTEQLSDTIALDAQGNATHNLSITLQYPVAQHLYTGSYVAAGGMWDYLDYMRIVVPPGARLVSSGGCQVSSVIQSGHVAWGCGFQLWRTQSLTLHFTWIVPKAAVPNHQALAYTLLLQKQAGTRDTLSLTIVPPRGSHLSSAPLSPLTVDPRGQVKYTGTLTRTQAWSVNIDL